MPHPTGTQNVKYFGDLSCQFLAGLCIDPKNLKLHICWHFFEIGGGSTVCASYLLAVHTSYIVGTIERKLIKKIRTLEKWLQYRPLPNSFPTNYILINSKVKVLYPKHYTFLHLRLIVQIIKPKLIVFSVLSLPIFYFGPYNIQKL